MTVILILVVFAAGIMVGRSFPPKEILAAAYNAGSREQMEIESENRSRSALKAAATRRRNRAPSPLFVEGAVPTDSEGAEA